MKCVICKNGETKVGLATLTLEKNGTTVVFKKVPANVCTTCGEEYVDEKITAKLLKEADDAASTGIQVEIREYTQA